MDKKPISKTTIDWFIENLPNRFKNAILNECGEEIKKAKAMEKEQIKKSFIYGGYDGLKFPKVREAFDRKYLEDKFFEYFKETYGEVH